MMWDGSDITEYLIDKKDVFSFVFNRKHYWIFHDKDKTIDELTPTSNNTVLVKRCTTSHPFIIDELKPVFNLPKTGTHRAMVGRHIHILYRLVGDGSGSIMEEITVNNIGTITNQLFIEQMQEIYAFRELLAIARSYDASISVRKGQSHYYPISCAEAKMDPYRKEYMVIPTKALDRWFIGVTIDEVVRRMVRIRCDDDIAERVDELRAKIYDVITRIDKNEITLCSHIINRLIARVS